MFELTQPGELWRARLALNRYSILCLAPLSYRLQGSAAKFIHRVPRLFRYR
jgi:hypothetical protein